jgi:sugar phosphate isomerase/epimerase
VTALPDGLMGVDLNPGKLLVNGFSPTEAVAQLGPHIRHVHASDACRDQSRRRGVEVTLGSGSAEFPELLGMLENYQYRGFITVERQACDNPEREIQLSMKYLLSL